jgi:hypothetical protein
MLRPYASLVIDILSQLESLTKILDEQRTARDENLSLAERAAKIRALDLISSWISGRESIRDAVKRSQSELAEVGDSLPELLKEMLDLIGTFCEAHNLAQSATFARRLCNEIDRLGTTDVYSRLEVLGERLKDELRGVQFFYVASDKAQYFESSTPAFGQDVFDKFPSAIDDIAEAGNCIALGRDTAAVFHLMRVMEAALKVLARELGVSYAPSWESYLRKIAKLVEGNWSLKTDQEKAKQPLYTDLAGDLQSIKIAWRNPTMHIVKKYGPEESIQIFNCVKQFMLRMAAAGFSE